MKSKILLFSLLGVLFIGQFIVLNRKVLDTRKLLSQRLKKYRRTQKALTYALTKTDPNFGLPTQLQDVPYVDGEIILDVKDIQIRNVFAPYNASLIEHDDNYLLFFRYDVVRQMHLNIFDTYVGCVQLNENFDQTEKEYVHIDTKSSHSEDPRILKNKDDYYLIYNDCYTESLTNRKIFLTNIDINTFETKTISKLDPHLAPVEKNWAPFSYNDNIHFEYQIFSPRKILQLSHPSNLNLMHLEPPRETSMTHWSENWGTPLGGTPARLVDGQYLGFFHSKFKDRKGTYWYVMGAYTFEPTPPFKITALSKEPLLYKGIYQTESINTSDPVKYVIFPAGFAIRNYGEKTLLHLSVGDNDSGVKILTIDKDKLLQSLE